MNLGIFKTYLLFSIVPVTQLVGLVPLLCTTYGFTIEHTGWIFFILRLSLLGGSFSTKYLLKWATPYTTLVTLEIISSTLSLICYFSLKEQNLILVTVFFVVRCLIVGIANNTRMTLLKNEEDQSTSTQAAVFSSAIVQASYVISGVLFIFSTLNKDLFPYAILLNIVTPLIAIFLLKNASLKKVDTSDKTISNKATFIDLGFCFEKSKRSLFLISVFTGLAFGGIDILCLTYGKEIYNRDFGYGIITIIYSVGFYIGYRAYASTKTTFIRGVGVSVSTLLLIFLYSLLVRHQLIDSFLLLLIFAIYGFFYATIEQEWYKNIDSKKSSSHFFLKDLIIALTYASGEVLYSQLHTIDRYLRIGFLFILILIIFYKKHSKLPPRAA